MSTLRLSVEQRAQIAQEARLAFPRECCGLIEGTRVGDETKASVLHATRNAARTADRFEVDPADHFRILRAVRANGTEVVGCYHSHPNGKAEPSAHDLESAHEMDFVWLIAALTDQGDARFQAFIVRSGSFAAMAME